QIDALRSACEHAELSRGSVWSAPACWRFCSRHRPMRGGLACARGQKRRQVAAVQTLSRLRNRLPVPRVRCALYSRAKILGHVRRPSPALRAPSPLRVPSEGEGWGEGSVSMRKPACLEIIARSYNGIPNWSGRILIPPPKARERTAAVCGAPAAAARRGQAYSDNSATLGIRTCCGWSFGHSRDPVVVPRCARRTGADLETTTTAAK